MRGITQAPSFLKKRSPLGSRKENRKGITPVVSVILLLLITISIVGFSLIFFQRTAQGAGEEAQTQLQQQLASASESFEIVNIDKNKVYVKNTGTANLQNLKFYVDGSAVQNATPISIAPNRVGEIILNNSQLAQVPGDRLRVTSVGFSQDEQAKFYGKETIAYWRFDESDGRTVKDYSGNGNDGTFVGENWNDGTVNGATPTTGKFGNALKFDGVDDYVDAGEFIENGIPAVTVSAWIKADSIVDTGGIFSTEGNPGNIILGFDATTKFRFRVYETGGGEAQAETTISDFVGNWKHVVGTFDSSLGSEQIKLYVNGILEDTTNLAGDGIIRTPGLKLRIGNDRGAPRVFDGLIDEVRIYNRALKPEEIIEDMNSAYPIARTVASYSFEKIEPKALDTHNIVKGRYGAAVSFDGVNDYINVSDSSSMDFSPSDSFSLEAWVKPVSTGAIQQIMMKGQDSGSTYYPVYRLDVTAGNKAYFLISSNSPSNLYAQITGGTTITDGNWHHVVAVRDRTAGDIKIYVDGISDAAPVAESTAMGLSSTQDLQIGRDYRDGAYVRYFNGTIDEVRILNVAR